MSDGPSGEGWWLASDGRWYPPTLHPAPLPPPPAPPPPQSNWAQPAVAWAAGPPVLSSTLSGWLQGLLWATAAATGVSAVLNLTALGAFNDFWDAPSWSDEDELRAWIDADDAVVGAGGFVFLTWIATFVLLLVWMNKAHKTTDALGPGPRKWSSGWTIGGWFIPLAQFVIPKMVLNEIERIALAPRAGNQVSSGWRQHPTVPLGWIWWIGLAAAIVLLGASNAAQDAPLYELGPDDVRSTYSLGAAGFGLFSAASICAVFHVRLIAKRLGPQAWTSS